MGIININNCLLIISDKNGAHELTVKVGEGNISYSENKPRVYTRDRGNLDTVKNDDAEPMSVSFDFTWEYLKAKSTDTTPTVEEALKKTGKAADWQSSSDDDCEPYAVNVRVENDPDCGSDGAEIISFPDFRYETLDHDVRDGSVSCSGNCNAEEAIKSRVEDAPSPVTGPAAGDGLHGHRRRHTQGPAPDIRQLRPVPYEPPAEHPDDRRCVVYDHQRHRESADLHRRDQTDTTV
jgi:hypothetical protein